MSIKRIAVQMVYLFSLIVLSSCSSSNESEKLDPIREKEASIINTKANNLFFVGKKIKAMRLLDQLWEDYSDTKVGRDAQAKWEKKGYSLGVALTSLTSIRMIEVENSIVEYRTKKGRFPTKSEIHAPMDGWGKLIFFKIFTMKAGYDFIVYSAGPDTKVKTDDDILIVHTEKGTYSKKEVTELAPDVISSISDLYQQENSANVEELNMSLDDVKSTEKDKDGSSSGEMEISIDDFHQFK